MEIFQEQRPVVPNDANAQIAEMVKLITRIGPDLAEVSRSLGIFKETVRYRYKRLLDKGFAVQAAPNHERLGLKRIITVADFAPDFKPFGEAILSAMRQLCYLTSYARTVPDGRYTIHFSVPEEHVNPWTELMNELRVRGVFRTIEFYNFDSLRVVPMPAELYDFENGVWDYEWSKPPKTRPDNVIYETPKKVKFDQLDLQIIEQLQYDANKTFMEIQEKLQINYKTLTWHFRNHILAKGLIKNYRVVWTGGTYDFKLEKGRHRKHTYAFIGVIVKNVNTNERMHLMSRMNSIPYLWAEAVGQDYYVQLPFPTDSITDMLGFLEETLAPVRDRARWSVEDQLHSLYFTIEPKLFDSERNCWTFNKSDLLARFETLLIEVKQRSGLRQSTR